jgi:hypothetical protein
MKNREYPIEVARALLALGARALHVYNDADDFIVDAHDLTRVPALEGLDGGASLNGGPTEEHGRGLLVRALHAALAARPAHVDMVVTDAEGRSRRHRWQPTSEPPGATWNVSDTDTPKSMTAPGLRVHVHEGFGASVVLDWIAGNAPEVERLTAALRHLRGPIYVKGEALTVPEPLVRTPIQLEGGLRGAIELRLFERPARGAVGEGRDERRTRSVHGPRGPRRSSCRPSRR